ncbi:MAG TPA: M23 family metallopeptidase [Desulfitobacterium sp.]|nr:M23 family metallopeptidase [Desulfitobacterium sp.]
MPKNWKTGLAYIVIILVLGLTSLTYGLARLELLPNGQEVVARGNEPQNITSGENEQLIKQSPDSGVADKSGTVSQGVSKRQETDSAATDQKQIKSEEQESKISAKNFPSPVQSEPLRSVGNYFSENLNAYLFHAGTDYPLPEGAVIRATHGGKVSFAGPDPILGQKVEVDCGENWHVVYGGLDNLRVQQGDVIEINDVLGQIGYFPGADGVNDRTQLHYEVWNGDQAQVQ